MVDQAGNGNASAQSQTNGVGSADVAGPGSKVHTGAKAQTAAAPDSVGQDSGAAPSNLERTVDGTGQPLATDGGDADAGEGQDATATTDPLAALTSERDKLREQLMRTAADFDNFRKRSERERQEAVLRAREDTIRIMLPVVDNLDRAAAAAKSASDVAAVAEGVDMVLRHFLDSVCLDLSLKRIETDQQRFDPNLHEAVQQVEGDAAPGTIVGEILSGYMFKGKLLRPAMVVVSKPPAAASADENPSTDTGAAATGDVAPKA